MATDEITQKKVAIKVLNRRKIKKLGMQSKVKREIQAMKALTHPHIIALYQVIDTPSDIFLVMELAQPEDLYDHLLEKARVSKIAHINQSKFSLILFADRGKRSQAALPAASLGYGLRPRQAYRPQGHQAGKSAPRQGP